MHEEKLQRGPGAHPQASRWRPVPAGGRVLMAEAFAAQSKIGDPAAHRRVDQAILLEQYYDPMYEYQLSQREGRTDVSRRPARKSLPARTGRRAGPMQSTTELAARPGPGGWRSRPRPGPAHAGHAAHRWPENRLTLVSPASHTPYSGMLPGLLAGHYSFEETHIDLARLCQWGSVRFLCAEVDRPSIRISVSCPWRGGHRSTMTCCPSTSDRNRNWTRYPVQGNSPHRSSRWRECGSVGGVFEPAADGRRVVVVGGGAGGIELVLAMAHRLQGKSTVLSPCTAALRRFYRTTIRALAMLGGVRAGFSRGATACG